MKYRENTSGLHILEIEVTKRCNLDCKHCYVGGNQAVDLDDEWIEKTIIQANDMGVNRLVFTGGEPLLHKRIFEFANFAREIGFPDIALLTNGTLITEETAEKCKVFSGIQMSLDGLPNKLGVLRKNYFAQLENAIALLQKNDIQITLYVTINKSNLTSIKDSIAYALGKNCKIAFNCLIPVREELKQLVPEPKELKSIFTDIVSIAKENSNVMLSHHFRFLVDKEKMNFFQSLPLQQGIVGGCLAGIAAGYVTAEGDFFPCPFIRKSCGNVKFQSLEDIWNNSDTLGLIRNRSRFQGKCGNCKFVNCCGGCRASSLYKYGELTNSDDNCFLGEIDE